ncbi:unnamed protein product [Bursaphelenchus okinawaensis]|uniref:Histone RNA hairpin-binding protein RNA-binding domain-containing protein n=1 Tax=Bursaphelenchus okinawaensis TaxID=465554 RepID=A0A811KTW1_9BILA|nr:unnamed protein product [Bursaphelenchus okinawaensis]CAG9110549.1 unnamed protein product [Bursaphelenchus okinawaensis]
MAPLSNKPSQVTQPAEEIVRRREMEIEKYKKSQTYLLYARHVLKDGRRPDDPQPPNKYANCSRRDWDSRMKIWKRKTCERAVASRERSGVFRMAGLGFWTTVDWYLTFLLWCLSLVYYILVVVQRWVRQQRDGLYK